ncbi:hypothetical protein PILCRDRAFT_813030 [Piloderma croceum F 1598]|uniref:Histone H1 n=1 Tax=Piloderma croceum (strain F 1598) TaxID=765440 RepID=A0A0C3GEP8_PILCF|nr:hypothetical protein PILCRDRAFT_813030 [Piloderma croceum F 1598]
MATATVPYGSTQPPAVNLYQKVPSEAEYHILKRHYLGLLPPQQIIEICLTFEVHVPFHVRASVWPSDLKAAIAALQRQSQPPPATPKLNQSNDTTSVIPRTADPPPTSLSDASQPVPPAKPPDTTSRPAQTSSSPAPSSTPTQTVTTTAPTNPPVKITQQPPYPHQPYGFPQQHASYPHAPYYNTPPAGYNYPHTPYPPYPPPTNYPPNASTPSTSVNQTVEAQLSAEDLPSYEDIIVEALMGCPDPEGSVPKNIFTWMSSHYPLQSNFRPSASQALQKAYKRGRLEKSSNGKYRLNPLWEGGSTTRRHTRRLQLKEQNQMPTPSTSTDKAPKASPFTRTPLEIKRATPSTSVAAGHAPYQGEPYPYSYPPPAQYPAHPSGLPQDDIGNGATTTEDTGEGSDAWEAAQNILKAINFGSLIQIDQEDVQGAGKMSSGNTVVQDETAALPPIISSKGVDASATGNAAADTVEFGPQERAALQAQLALLAAQMAELADGDEDALTPGLSPVMAGLPTTQVAETKAQADEEDGEGDDDDDMEMVEVPADSDVLRT